ncbi:hypothetical protein PO909_008615 [Leuciscus waleckii]
MSDRFVKPGNQEHGWNDPPQFSYGLQKDPGGPKRNILNKRVHAPQLTGPGSEMQSTPVAGITPPRGINPPPMDIITPPSMSPRIPSDITAELETEPCIEDVQEPLYWALNACRHTVKYLMLWNTRAGCSLQSLMNKGNSPQHKSQALIRARTETARRLDLRKTT